MLSLVVIFASLLLVAGWEFCRPRRQREFPALRRRLGNVGIWVLNVILAGFTFEPVGTFPPVVRSTSIGVMQGVKTPQKRHRVLTAIYRVDQKVEQ